MAKSRARFLAELLGSDGLVKTTTSSLAGADGIIDLGVLPSIPNSKLTNSSITINSSATSLGGSVTLTTANVAENTNLYYTDARADARITAADTGDLSEGSNLYYTDARADARIAAADTGDLSEGSNLYYTDARADARVALIVDSAPGTLNTLNELAAALGDDANFSTTVTNSIATKLPLAGGTITGTTIITGTAGRGLVLSNATESYTNNIAVINAQHSQGILQFKTANTERMRIDKDGNVGIGTTNPSKILEVSGPGGSGGTIMRLNQEDGSGSSGPTMDFGYSGQAWRVGANVYTTGDFVIYDTNTTTKMIMIKGNGNVGIGTSNPAQNFVVAAATNGIGIELVPGTLNYIQAYNRGTSDYGDLKIDAQTIRFGLDNGAEKVRIDSSGNVGIGTDAPGNKLHVKTSAAGNIAKIEGETGRYIYTGTDGSGHYIEQVATSATTRKLRIQGSNGSGTYTQLYIDGGNQRIYTNSGVNIGIGTDAPAGKLHIQSGDAGTVTPSSQADDLVVEASTEGGITIMTPDDQSARIRFTSPSTETGDLGGATIFYRQNINKMLVGTAVAGGVLSLASGAGNESLVLASNGAATFSSTIAAGAATFTDGTSFSTGLTIENTGDTHGSVIDFFNNSDSPADNDYVGGLIFKETNSAGGTHSFAKIFGMALDITDGTEDGALTFETSAGGANTIEHMRIDASGNVGIGTEGAVSYTPLTLETASGSAFTAGGVNGVGLMLRNRSSTVGTSSGIKWAANTSYHDLGGIHMVLTGNSSTNETADLTFFTSNSGDSGNTEKMRITSDGRVGIGVTPKTNWNSSYDVLQIGQTSAIWSHRNDSQLLLASNFKFDSNGSAYRLGSGYAADVIVEGFNGKVRIRTSPTDAAADSVITDMADRLVVLPAGNVGIGTASPSYLVHADAAVATDPSYIVAGSGSNFVMAMGSQNRPGVAQEAFIGTLSDQRFKIKVNNVEKATFTSTGFGLGTNDPKRPLQIGATNQFPISFNGNYPDIHFNTYYESGWRIHTAGFGAKTTFNGATGAWVFSNVASSQSAAATFTPLDRFAILANGNVGIGTATPASRLHIKTSTNQNLELEETSGNLRISALNDARSANVALQFAASEFNFLTGNVGIGTDAPGTKLDVIGNVRVHAGNVWSETTQGGNIGSIHIDPNSATDHAGGSITFGASDTSNGTNAHAGIYVRSDGSYGTKMYLSTTDSYASGSKTSMSIDHYGNVHLPRGRITSQVPAFNAYNNSNSFAPGGNYTFAANATRFNNGSHFNTSTYRFTAPVDGLYRFYFRTITNGSAGNQHVVFVKNGSDISGTNTHFSPNGGTVWDKLEMATLLDLADGDYITVKFVTLTISIHGNAWNEFSGHLIG